MEKKTILQRAEDFAYAIKRIEEITGRKIATFGERSDGEFWLNFYNEQTDKTTVTTVETKTETVSES